MPYIKQQFRPKFANDIKAAISVISDNSESWYNRGDYFGYFVNRLVKHFVGGGDYQGNAFNSAHFSKEKRQALTNAADSLAAEIGRSEPITNAGDLNYCITAVLWALLGDKKGIEKATYGLRCYLKSFLLKVQLTTEAPGGPAGISNAEITKGFRRHLVALSVLDDVMSETYRVKTADYEDEKKAENGDVWPLVTAWREDDAV